MKLFGKLLLILLFIAGGYYLIQTLLPLFFIKETPSIFQDPQAGYIVKVSSPFPTPTVTIFSPTSRPTITKKVGDTSPWGVSRQLDEHTWTIKVGSDAVMATPQEILSALNEYRHQHGSQILTWNDNLAEFAKSRAIYLNQIKTTDSHKGFIDYLENQDGYNRLGFTWLGENISYGLQVNGVHLIEWVYAGDKPHDDNQLDNKWNYVGIGVDHTATCLIFGTGKR